MQNQYNWRTQDRDCRSQARDQRQSTTASWKQSIAAAASTHPVHMDYRSPSPVLNCPQWYVNIIKSMELVLRNVDLPALIQETIQPTTDGDQYLQPTILSPTDCTSGLCFLIDTGAEVSVILPSATDCPHHKDSLSLQAANNISITTYGIQLLSLYIGLCHILNGFL